MFPYLTQTYTPPAEFHLSFLLLFFLPSFLFPSHTFSFLPMMISVSELLQIYSVSVGGPFFQFLENFHRGGSFQYSLCSVQITIQHILLDCPKLNNARNKFELPTSLLDVLRDDPESIANLFNFLRANNIFTKRFSPIFV